MRYWRTIKLKVNNPDKKVIIIGAGPSGLSAACKTLEDQSKKVFIIEKESNVGGLSKTLEYGEFKTDIGPHRFFTKNKEILNFVKDLLGDELLTVKRITRFYIDRKYYFYPIKLGNVLKNIGFLKSGRIILEYIYERIKRLTREKKVNSLEEFFISEFGKTLSNLNMINYSEKIWGISPKHISADWAQQRIKKLSIIEILKNLFLNKNNTKTLIDYFYYPRFGSSMLYEYMKKMILKSNRGEIEFNTFPEVIYHNHCKIYKILFNGKKHFEVNINGDVISSIPITILLSKLEPPPPQSVLNAFKCLKFRSHISLIILLDKPRIFDDQWIYFPNKEIPFGRIMEPKNFSSSLSPPQKTSLVVEFFCDDHDNIWNMDKDKLFHLVYPHLERLKYIEYKEVMNYFIHKEKDAYPIYKLNYLENLKVIKEYLSNIKNLIVIGRNGLFRYNNQDHAIEMGLNVGRNINKINLINIEESVYGKEYFEKGKFKIKTLENYE